MRPAAAGHWATAWLGGGGGWMAIARGGCDCAAGCLRAPRVVTDAWVAGAAPHTRREERPLGRRATRVGPPECARKTKRSDTHVLSCVGKKDTDTTRTRTQGNHKHAAHSPTEQGPSRESRTGVLHLPPANVVSYTPTPRPSAGPRPARARVSGAFAVPARRWPRPSRRATRWQALK